MALTSRRFSLPIAVFAVVFAGCGGGGGGGGGADSAPAAAPPARAGQVWELEPSEDRAYIPGSIVAFVNGVHVMVVDDDRVYAGMTPLATANGSNGARTITFTSGLIAEMVPSATGAEMRFSTGERVLVHARQSE